MSVQFERWRLEPGEFADICTHPNAKALVYYCSDDDPELKWRKAQPWGKVRPVGLHTVVSRILVPILTSYTNDRQELYHEMLECLPYPDGHMLAYERAAPIALYEDQRQGAFQFGIAWSSMPFLIMSIDPERLIKDDFVLEE